MIKTELQAQIAKLETTTEVRDALQTIANSLSEKPSQEDHGISYWLIGHTTNGQALLLAHYPE